MTANGKADLQIQPGYFGLRPIAANSNHLAASNLVRLHAFVVNLAFFRHAANSLIAAPADENDFNAVGIDISI